VSAPWPVPPDPPVPTSPPAQPPLVGTRGSRVRASVAFGRQPIGLETPLPSLSLSLSLSNTSSDLTDYDYDYDYYDYGINASDGRDTRLACPRLRTSPQPDGSRGRRSLPLASSFQPPIPQPAGSFPSPHDACPPCTPPKTAPDPPAPSRCDHQTTTVAPPLEGGTPPLPPA
jgi:hypothetical protein